MHRIGQISRGTRHFHAPIYVEHATTIDEDDNEVVTEFSGRYLMLTA